MRQSLSYIHKHNHHTIMHSLSHQLNLCLTHTQSVLNFFSFVGAQDFNAFYAETRFMCGCCGHIYVAFGNISSS